VLVAEVLCFCCFFFWGVLWWGFVFFGLVGGLGGFLGLGWGSLCVGFLMVSCWGGLLWGVGFLLFAFFGVGGGVLGGGVFRAWVVFVCVGGWSFFIFWEAVVVGVFLGGFFCLGWGVVCWVGVGGGGVLCGVGSFFIFCFLFWGGVFFLGGVGVCVWVWWVFVLRGVFFSSGGRCWFFFLGWAGGRGCVFFWVLFVLCCVGLFFLPFFLFFLFLRGGRVFVWGFLGWVGRLFFFWRPTTTQNPIEFVRWWGVGGWGVGPGGL